MTIDHILSTWKNKAWFQSEGKLLVAISGGADSMFLGHILSHMGKSFAVAHVHHGLRPESDQEAELVAHWAEKWAVPFHKLDLAHTHWQQAKGSLQAQARKLRYAFFEEVMDTQGYSYCLTAHHRDDQAETILMSMLKGKSGHLRMIPAQRGRFIRPLLRVSAQEIRDWMDHHAFPYAVDASNFSPKYLRGRVRHHALAPLMAQMPEAPELLIRRAEALNNRLDVLNELLDMLLTTAVISGESDSPALSFSSLAGKSPELLVALTARWLESFPLTPGEHIKVLEILDAQTGGAVPTSVGSFQRTREGLMLLRDISGSPARIILAADALPCHWNWRAHSLALSFCDPQKGISTAPNVWRMDADQVHFPIIVGPWTKGDRMKPLGAPGEKKLSDIFVDAKFNPDQKQHALIISDQKGIIGLTGYRMADRVKVTTDTHRMLEIIFS